MARRRPMRARRGMRRSSYPLPHRLKSVQYARWGLDWGFKCLGSGSQTEGRSNCSGGDTRITTLSQSLNCIHQKPFGQSITEYPSISQILHSLANLTFVVLWPDADPDGTLATGRCNNLKLRICRNAQGWKRNTNADDRLSTLRQNQSLKEALLRRMRPAFRPIMRCVRRPDRCG